jgi:cellulose biosynthesis protein BcsQ
MADILRRNGETITFYSYKGGVGRSMALINAACLLALKGKKVLIIDWDLEAPGLHSFFNGKIKPSNPGLVDFVLKISKSITSKKLEFDEEIKELVSKEIGKYILKELTLGKETKVKLDIYQNSPPLFRSIAYYLESIYDYILIDSRTGLADTAGISTMLMPSKLVLVYVLNKQNLDGVEKVARQAVDYRNNSMDERQLSIYPLPSRIEKSTNPSDQKTWRDFHQKRFESIFKEIYHLDKCNLDNYIDKCQIPYVISYAYGENIPVLSERITDANTISFDYNNFLETLISGFQPWEVEGDWFYVKSSLVEQITP